MAIVSVPNLYIPSPTHNSVSQSLGFAAMTLDASGELAAAVLQAPKTGSIRKVHFRTGTVTTATDTDVRIETVDAATGNPSGTLFGTTTNVTVASGSLSANTWITTGNLTADASVTKGDRLAVVVAPSGSPNYQVVRIGGGYQADVGFPYATHFASSSWTKSDAATPVVALEYSDGSFACMPYVTPFTAVNTHTVGTGSTPDEVALKFQLAAPVRATGAWLRIDGDADYDVILYDSDGSTSLASVSVDADIRSSAGQSAPTIALFTGTASLTAATNYYLAIKPTTASTLTAYSFDVNAAAILDQMDGGQNFHWAQQTDAGGWSATTTRRPIMGLIIDGIDDGAGGGSGGEGPLIGGRLVR